MRTLNHKIRELVSLRDALGELVSCCHGNDDPDCPILSGLSGEDEGRTIDHASCCN